MSADSAALRNREHIMIKRATIKDVAQKAGVSIATVSFVLNKHPNEVISPKVRKKVRAAARALEYHPSAAAAGLARSRTRNISVILYRDEVTISNQFYSFVVQGAITEAMERDYHLLFAYVPNAYRGASDLPKVVQERNTEGAVFIQRISPKLVRDIQKRGLPVVAVDHFPAMKKVDSLQIDNRAGGALAAEHLIGLGHTQLGFVQAAADRPSIAERGAGFKETIRARGLSFSERSNVLQCDDLKFEASYRRVFAAFKRKRRTTALFCANDEMAAGALRAAHELGLRVPDDLSVVGFDNITMSNYTDPALTTVSVEKERLGRRAIARLIDLVEGNGGGIRRETVPVKLVLRGSSARPRT